MKQALNIYGILILYIAVFSGCSKNITNTENVKDVVNNDFIKEVPVFSATLEQSTPTKTILQNDGKIYWSPEDSISVFGKNEYKFISTLKEEAPITEFTTEDNFEDADGHSFVAVYPYRISDSFDGESVTLCVPSSQIASSSTFDKNAFVMLAKSNEHTLSFRNLCGGIKVSITEEGVNKIVFKGNKGEVLAGKVNVVFDESGCPVVSDIIEKKTSVELIAPHGDSFKVGEWYYLTCLPVDLKRGYTIEFYKAFSQVSIEASLVSELPKEIKRSVWGRIKKADEDRPYDNISLDDNVIIYKTTDGLLANKINTNTQFDNVLQHYKDEESGYNVVVLAPTTRIYELFQNCGTVTYIALPPNITSLKPERNETGPFMNCVNLKEIHIPESVTSIGSCAFYSCRSLVDIDIPSGVTTIGKQAFAKCRNLKRINLPGSITFIGEDAFSGCENIVELSCGQYVASSSKHVIRDLFSAYKKIEQIHLYDDVTSIGDGAFQGCENLVSVNIPSGVTTIGRFAFSVCFNLKNIDIQRGVRYIGDNAFSRCESLESIDIPSGVTTIGDEAFELCRSLARVTLPDSITQIGAKVFYSCRSLESIDIPSGVTTIGDDAFVSCSSLARVTLPDSITTIGNHFFMNCSSLGSIDIPSGVTTIGIQAFYGCRSLARVTLPDSITTIGVYAFFNCESLESINIPSGVTTIGTDAFSGCRSLARVKLPDSITKMGDGVFYGCSSLESINIPSGVTTIGDGAFSSCSSLESIDIPSGVTTIGDGAFYKCSSLISVFVNPITPPNVGNKTFENNSPDRRIYVPSASLSSYKKAERWKDYAFSIYPM